MLRRNNNNNNPRGGGGSASRPPSSSSSSSLTIASGRPTSGAANPLSFQNPHVHRWVPLVAMAACAVVLLLWSDALLLTTTHLSLAWQLPPPGPLHFCTVPTIQTRDEATLPLDIAHQCQGSEYDTMTTALHAFAEQTNVHERTWGRRLAALPAASTVLALGNADTQQIVHAMACQYGAVVHEDAQKAVQTFQFSDPNATLVLLTHAGESLGNVTTPEGFATTIQQQTGLALGAYHAILWGLLHDCGAVSAACPNTTQGLYFTAAQIFTHGPMLFLSMMADARAEQSTAMRDAIRNTKSNKGPRKLWFLSGRRYISQVRLEGATIYGHGTDADNAPKTGKIGHRCTGAAGGHADLLAFDVTEFLYTHLAA